jgi:hypothetical protein
MRRESFLRLLIVAPIAAALRPLIPREEPVKYVQKSFGLGFRVSQEMIEDDLMYPGRVIFMPSDRQFYGLSIHDHIQLVPSEWRGVEGSNV